MMHATAHGTRAVLSMAEKLPGETGLKSVMNLEALFHALISILHQYQHGAACRLLTDPRDIVVGKDVPDGTRFKQNG